MASCSVLNNFLHPVTQTKKMVDDTCKEQLNVVYFKYRHPLIAVYVNSYSTCI